MFLVTMPLTALGSLAVLVHSGRLELAGYPLVAAFLMSLGQMGLYVGSEILASEREEQTIELVVASPSSYPTLLFTRIISLTSLGILGAIEAWLIARIVFGIAIIIYHPLLLATTLVLTVFAAAATSLITSAWFCYGRTTRTYQNALSGPLYLLSGVLVPVTFLPEVLHPFSRGLFLFWSADLLRDTLQPATPQSVAFRLTMIVILGIVGGAIGAWLIHRMLDRHRREGTLSL
jgi:ABC-2 type transport system permease protein